MPESALPPGGLVERLRSALALTEEIAHSMPPFPWRFDGDSGDVLAADGVVVAEPWALSTNQERNVGRFIAAQDPAHVLRTVAAHRKILDEHAPILDIVEWPHDQNGKGQAMVCPRCQNADHSHWNPPQGRAGVLPVGFITPYILAPCNTLLALAAVYFSEETTDGTD